VYWRHIFLDGDLGWRWQCMDKQHNVIAESMATISDYATCLLDATRNGYLEAPP
jgi:hypothetical protein